MKRKRHPLLSLTGLFFVLFAIVGGILVGQFVTPQWIVSYQSIQVEEADGELSYTWKGKPVVVDEVTEIAAIAEIPPEEADEKIVIDEAGTYSKALAQRHWGFWSLLPAVVAIGMCLTLRDPLISLFMGIVAGAFVLGQFDLTGKVFRESFATSNAVTVLILYLLLLGGLMGVWSRTGAAEAFAHWAAKHFVRGPRSAKLVTWGLGIVFFQGGTVSTVLVGTSVKPLADEEKVSHEELSYVVDSTASPIAILLAFNAWPAYVQALIFVPGVAVLATVDDRLRFFFASLPLSFYAIFAVLFTFLLSIERFNWIQSPKMRRAMKRSRETGQLDRPGSEPLLSEELQASHVPEGYRPNVLEFAVPLALLTGIAIGTYAFMGSPKVEWAFGVALVVAFVTPLFRGMSLIDLMEGIGIGLKGVVVASVILLMAVTLASITKNTGGGAYLVSVLADHAPYLFMPMALMLLAMVIAFATGTSWGTFAVAFPLAMPLAASLAESNNLERPMLYLMTCFAAVLNGAVYGDQYSPISDTTILSSMTTGADLMDHVKTQIVPATLAAVLAIIGWQVVVIAFC